ncbi:MAG: hypothetical protein R2827_15470 [Bdellovibrionales bacterium]
MAKNLKQAVADKGADSVALVLTGQYSEEYEALVGYFTNEIKSKNIYHWVNNPESFDEFDGLLLRGDKNPNTKGLLNVLEKHGVTATWSDLEAKLNSGAVKSLVVAGPENQSVFPVFLKSSNFFQRPSELYWLSAGELQAMEQAKTPTWLIPEVKNFLRRKMGQRTTKKQRHTFKKFLK